LGVCQIMAPRRNVHGGAGNRLFVTIPFFINGWLND
jgi:hypothetical protein